jgi:hypothetical protein
MPLADIAFLVRSASVSGPFGGGTDGLLRPSRPGEFHPEPLTDPDLTLSRHPARATAIRVDVLVNPADVTNTESTLRQVEPAGRVMGLQIQVLNASTSHEIWGFLRFCARTARCTLRRPSPVPSQPTCSVDPTSGAPQSARVLSGPRASTHGGAPGALHPTRR